MKDRKKTVLPKKKAIKKPRFIKYFAIWLAIFLVISMAASYFVIGVCRQTAKTKALSKWNSYTRELTKLVNDYCAADDDVREEYYGRLRNFVLQYGEDMNEYCSVYVDNQKICETPSGPAACVLISYSIEDSVYNLEKAYFLEDPLYLEPIYRSGEYNAEKNAYLIDAYSVENKTLEDLAGRLGHLPATYRISFASIYINEKTHTFIPGKAVISYNTEDKNTYLDEEDEGSSYIEIDCTPKDTKGYKLIGEGSGDDSDMTFHTYDGCVNPVLTDLSEAESITNDSSDDMLIDFLPTLYSWECLTSTAESYSNKACFKVLPLTTTLILIVAGLVSILLALTVSSIIYSSKKAVWQIFEYRKKTTAAMAHDLKTPLAAMSAYAENLEYDIDSDKRAYYSSKVRENVAFMNKTIESILMFTKSETGTAKSAARDIDVHALIEDEYNAVAKLFEDKNIKVEIKGEGHVKSNKELIDQAVRNLIGNAAKYTRPDTTLDITIDNKGFTMTNLTDQKIKNVKDLKKPFVKGEESRGTESGAGLGLSIVENCLLSAGHSLDIEFEDKTFKSIVRW